MSKEKTLRFKSLEVVTIIDHLENKAAFSPSWEQRYDLDADELVERPESEWKETHQAFADASQRRRRVCHGQWS